MSTLDQAMNYLADRADVGTYTTHNASKSVSANTDAEVQNFQLPPGTWLIVSHMDLSKSGTSVYNHGIAGAYTVRSTEVNGGGSTNIAVMNLTSTTTIHINIYVHIACTARSHVWAVKLAPA